MKKKALRCRNIYTSLSPALTDGYVICGDDEIIFVGSEADGKELIDSETEIFDFEDNFLMPGFNDFHVHLLSGALMEKDGVLRYAESEEEAVRQLLAKNPEDTGDRWILGGAWDNFRWPEGKLPTKESLDRY